VSSTPSFRGRCVLFRMDRLPLDPACPCPSVFERSNDWLSVHSLFPSESPTAHTWFLMLVGSVSLPTGRRRGIQGDLVRPSWTFFACARGVGQTTFKGSFGASLPPPQLSLSHTHNHTASPTPRVFGATPSPRPGRTCMGPVERIFSTGGGAEASQWGARGDTHGKG